MASKDRKAKSFVHVNISGCIYDMAAMLDDVNKVNSVFEKSEAQFIPWAS